MICVTLTIFQQHKIPGFLGGLVLYENDFYKNVLFNSLSKNVGTSSLNKAFCHRRTSIKIVREPKLEQILPNLEKN